MRRTTIPAALALLVGCSSTPTDPSELSSPAPSGAEPTYVNPAPKPNKAVHDATMSGYLGGTAGTSSSGSWGYRREGGFGVPDRGIMCTRYSTNPQCVVLAASMGVAIGTGMIACSKVARPPYVTGLLGCVTAVGGAVGAYKLWDKTPGNEGNGWPRQQWP
jgi:hypothetical protein